MIRAIGKEVTGMPKEERVTIKIPRALYKKIKESIKGTSYNSVTDFIIYVLRDVVSAKTKSQTGENFTKKEIGLIRQRLRNLGYI